MGNQPEKLRLADDTAILECQLRECFGRVVYSHKTHEKCADILLALQSRLRNIQIVLSALTTAGFVSVALGTGQIGAICGGVISTVLLALNSYTKAQDLGELAQKHRQAGSDLWIIREKYFSLLADLRMQIMPLNEMITRREDLMDELHGVYSGTPSTNYKAYRKAQEALTKLEDMTFSDAEIDRFLPDALRKT